MTPAGPDGILPVDKPVGPTSHDVVGRVRRALGTRKVGHTGTLDPFASGLMLVCIGRSTRLSQFLTGMDKSYVATARLGVRTDTLDDRGTVIDESDAWRGLDRATVAAALDDFRGPIDQVPPQYSAKKVEGEAMHRRARRGERVELAPRPVTVHELEIEFFDPPELRFRCRCSSGTYIRAIARDLGDALGVGAHLTDLRRTSVGSFDVVDALSLDDLDDADRVAGAWIDPLDALAHLPRVDVDEAGVRALGYGQRVEVPEAADADVVAVAAAGALVAVGRVADGTLAPRKVFVG